MRLWGKIRGHIQRVTNSKESAGLSAVIRLEVLRLAGILRLPQPAIWRVRPRQVLHPLQARLRGSSDLMVFDQVLICQEYSCVRDLKEPSLVLDLGANVGFSAAYFLSVFPRAFVVAVEPDERNLEICKANLAPYGDRVLVLHGAVWSRSTTLRVLKGMFRDGLEWATQVGELTNEEPASAGIQAWDVGSLIEMSGVNTVDLLKVDIERAELVVFGKPLGPWLQRVRNICVELHGEDCKEVFFAALKDFDYELGHFGELTICRNLRPRKIPQPEATSPDLVTT
jgi:FkbM family methyltransferase